MNIDNIKYERKVKYTNKKGIFFNIPKIYKKGRQI